MPYQISWYQQNEIVHLEIADVPDLAVLLEINQMLVELLNQSDRRLILLMNTEAMKVSHDTVSLLKSSQKYVNHPKLKMILSFAPDKLTRFVFMMAFSIASVSLAQFDDRQKLDHFLQHLIAQSAKS